MKKLVPLTCKKKTAFVEWDAVIGIIPRFFFRGSRIHLLSGTIVKIDQTPEEVMAFVLQAQQKQQQQGQRIPASELQAKKAIEEERERLRKEREQNAQ